MPLPSRRTRSAPPWLWLLAAAVLVPSPALAFWPANGIPITTASGAQLYPRVISDGQGGVYVGWPDGSRGRNYLQHVHSDGSLAAGWPLNGIPVCTFAGATAPDAVFGMCTDGAGGVIVAWGDQRVVGSTAFLQVYAQHVLPDGTLAWDSNGVPVCTASIGESFPQAVADGSGGAYVCWLDSRSNDGRFVPYAQHLSPGGAPLWGSGLVLDPNAYADRFIPMATRAGGGFAAAWEDQRNGSHNYDVYAQIVHADGSLSRAGGIPMCTMSLNQLRPSVVTDDAQGVYCAWTDFRSGTAAIFANEYDEATSLFWAAGGEQVAASSEADQGPGLVGVGSGGVLVGWTDFGNAATAPDVFAQHLATNGAVAGSGSWVPGGLAVEQGAWAEKTLALVGDGFGGALAVWADSRTAPEAAIYVRGFRGTGTSPWPAGGQLVASTNTGEYLEDADAIGDGTGGVYVTYGVGGDIYLNRVDPPIGAAVPSRGGHPFELAVTPNPFGASLHLSITTPVAGRASIQLLDLTGRVVATLADASAPAGTTMFDWRPSDDRPLAPGVYAIRARVGARVRVERVVMLR